MESGLRRWSIGQGSRNGKLAGGKGMHLIQTDDFETVKRKYIEVIENTPDIEKYARWEYGKHPTDESLKEYINRGEMYVLMDGEEIAGMAAVAMCQGNDYLNIPWVKELTNDEVATVHLLAVCPDHRGKSLGLRILDEAMRIAVRNGRKSLRLDTLKSNIPAQKMYDKAGFVYRGEQRLYAENTGMTDFLYYEKVSKAADMFA